MYTVDREVNTLPTTRSQWREYEARLSPSAVDFYLRLWEQAGTSRELPGWEAVAELAGVISYNTLKCRLVELAGLSLVGVVKKGGNRAIVVLDVLDKVPAAVLEMPKHRVVPQEDVQTLLSFFRRAHNKRLERPWIMVRGKDTDLAGKLLDQ